MTNDIKMLRDISSGRNGHFQGKIIRSTKLGKRKGNGKEKKNKRKEKWNMRNKKGRGIQERESSMAASWEVKW